MLKLLIFIIGFSIAYIVNNYTIKNSFDYTYIINCNNISQHIPRNVHELHINNIDIEGGVIYTGNPKILKSVCPGEYGTIKPIGICMIGSK